MGNRFKKKERKAPRRAQILIPCIGEHPGQGPVDEASLTEASTTHLVINRLPGFLAVSPPTAGSPPRVGEGPSCTAGLVLAPVYW